MVDVADDANFEERVTALEARMDVAAADAAAARHLAAARDRDLSEFATKIDTNRQAINALGVQVAGRFSPLDRRFDGLESTVDTGFAGMRGRFDATAAGQQQIVDLLTGLIGDEGSAG